MKNYIIKNIISIILSIIMIFSCSIYIFAYNDGTSEEIVVFDGIEYTMSRIVGNDGTTTSIVTDGTTTYTVVKKGNLLTINEKSALVDYTYSTYIDSQLINNNSSRVIHSVEDYWWGFSAYYNTSSAYQDLYWRNCISTRNPSQMYYFASYGTPLMSYSESFYSEVVNMVGYQSSAVAILGATMAASIAAGLASLISGGALTPAAVLAVIAAYVVGAATYLSVYYNACVAAANAEGHYSKIISILGY